MLNIQQLKCFSDAHDSFLIIDNTEQYHIGASIKDLGKKYFTFTIIDPFANNIVNKLKVVASGGL